MRGSKVMKSKTHIRFLSLMLVVVVSISTAIANEGNCLLKIVAANDLAKTASVYIDGKLEGTLESGELTIFDLDVGNHIITLDGELIEKHELEVVFQSTYESKRIDLEANPGKRAVRITSEPSNALIRIDNEWLEQKTPWQIILEAGKTYEIELSIERHGNKIEALEILEKGGILVLDITIPEATSPQEPRLINPSDGATDLTAGEVNLEWESFDSGLEFEVEFNGEVHKTQNTVFPVELYERGREYTWKVTAINEFAKRSSSERFSFTTVPNAPPDEPSYLFPGNATDNYPDALILQWECKDPDEDSLTYDVTLGIGDDLTVEETGILSTKLLVSELKTGTQYFWKVIAKDDFGGIAEGPLWTFSTENCASKEELKAGSLFEIETNKDVSSQIESLKEKIVSLEWGLEEIKNIIRENTKAAKNTLTSAIPTLSLVSSASEEIYFSEEEGSGVRIGVESDFKGHSIIHDSDILVILNELYSLKATKISLNGKRILPYTYVRCVGSTAIVDGEPTQMTPMVIEVLGDYDYLVSGLSLLQEAFRGREIDMTFLPLEYILIPASTYNDSGFRHELVSITYALFLSGIEKVKLVAGSHEIISSGQRAELEVDWPLDFDTVYFLTVLEDSAELIGSARVNASTSSRYIPIISESGETKGSVRIDLK
jgi:uncharacterized protein YlxW (UPF0749 family)